MKNVNACPNGCDDGVSLSVLCLLAKEIGPRTNQQNVYLDWYTRVARKDAIWQFAHNLPSLHVTHGNGTVTSFSNDAYRLWKRWNGSHE